MIGSGGRRLRRALRGVVTATRPGRSSRSALHPVSGLPEEPLLSVVVPVYQVEAYLAECLESLLRMRYRRLEVVVVDDGSTDGSAEVAARYAAQDDRVRVVRQENAGLGAARNRGIAEATGDLVTFVDSDDTVTAGGYAKMVRLLRQTGSDFAVGSLRRQVHGRYLERHWLRRLHAEQRVAITIDDAPDMLGNIWAVTKVFRRDFLERIGLLFPVGVRYEDQVPITRAYLEARSFDVITESVYLWRTRVEGTSITQQKHHADDLRDRLAAKQQVADLLSTGASPSVVSQWYTKVFRLDLMPYFRAALVSEETSYWEVLTSATAWLVERAPEATWSSLELRFRVAARLAARRDRDALTRLLEVPQLETSNFPVRRVGDDLVADLDLGLGADEADELLRLQDVDLPSTAQLDEVVWDDGRVTLRGSALIRHLPPTSYDVRTTLSLRPPSWSSSPAVPLVTHPEPNPEANRFARRVHDDHEGSGLSAVVDLRDVVRASDPTRPTLWRTAVELEAGRVRRSGWFAFRNDVGTARGRHAALVDEVLVTDSWDRRRGWGVSVHHRHAAVLEARLHPDTVIVRLHVSPGQSVDGLQVGEEPVAATIAVDPDDPALRVVTAALSDLTAAPPGPLRVRSEDAAATDAERQHGLPLVVVGDLDWVAPPPGSTSGVALEMAGDRTLTVAPRAPHVLLDEVRFAGDALEVAGAAHDVDGFTLALRGDRVEGSPCDVEVAADGTFRARVPTTFTFWDGTRSTLWRDVYQLVATSPGAEVVVRASSALQRSGRPQQHGWRMRISASRAVALRRVKDLGPREASAHGRYVLRSTVYAEAREGPRREAVLFEAFAGTSTGDNPGAVCRELLDRGGAGLELLWSVADAAIPAPAGTTALLQGSPAWFEALGAARFIVTNGLLPSWFAKADDQVVVQTWRGQPVRRRGADVLDPRVLDEDDTLLLRQAAEWDLLASPSPFCTETLTPLLGLQGRVAETGSPRDDLLLARGGEALRDVVRRRLGVVPDQTLVLYAPTWREWARVAGHHEKVLLLEAELLTAARADVVVLVRGHANTFARPSVRGERVVDVTTYPDLAELFLAADLLVTDWSSAVFDFALTDKPIVLLAPDLEEYQQGARGLYVDLADDPPGPLVSTTAEVLAVLDALPDRADAFGDARKRTRETYGALEDGHAAQRLLSLVLGDSSR